MFNQRSENRHDFLVQLIYCKVKLVFSFPPPPSLPSSQSLAVLVSSRCEEERCVTSLKRTTSFPRLSLSPGDKVKIAAKGPLWLALQSPRVKGVSLRSNLSIWGSREKPPFCTSRVRPSLERSLAVRASVAINGELASNIIGTSLFLSLESYPHLLLQFYP